LGVVFHLQEFWRVGYHVEPLTVSLEYQTGEGRFDDPEGSKTVLYGADSALTCIFENALPWIAHQEAAYVQQAEAPDADTDDPELQEMELQQAERDRAIAMRAFQMPVDLYDKAKVYVLLKEPIVLCDLDDVGVRIEMGRLPEIASLMSKFDVPHLDRSVITGQGPYLQITRAISGQLMRTEFFGRRFAGLRALGRHRGECYMLFENRFDIERPLAGPVRLHREDPDVREAASQLRLVP